MRLTLFFGLMFLVVGLVNTFDSKPDATDPAGFYAFAFTLLATSWLLRRHRSNLTAFLLWLAAHEEGIRNGGLTFEGKRMTEETELRQFQAAVSFLVVSVKFRSRYYVVGEEATALQGAGFTLCSLLFGWWGVPWGPIFTISTVASNLRGGVTCRVGDLLEQLNGHREPVVSFAEKTASASRSRICR